jgi:hypothetical protein
LLLSAPILAEEKKIKLDFGDGTFSADIREAPLRAVIEEIEDEVEGIWFRIWLKGSKTTLHEKVSVQFKDLPIQDGMERIFSMVNCSLIFDKHSKLLGVFLLGRPARARGRVRRGRTPRRAPRQYIGRR